MIAIPLLVNFCNGVSLCIQGCHQIKEFRENLGKIFQNIRKNQGIVKFHVNLFQSNEFFHTESHIQLSMTIGKVFPFVYPYEVQFCNDSIH